jgi:hypothetical protein
MLTNLKGVRPEVIKQVLLNDKPAHTMKGLYIEHFWENYNANLPIIAFLLEK